MIQFGKIQIEGFCSIENLTLNLNRPGWNVLTGENGAGKTSIFSALSWVIFGKTLKSKNTVIRWKHLKDSDYNGVKVKVDIAINGHTLTIIRCESYRGKIGQVVGKSNLFVYIDREEQTKFKDKKDKQKFIEKTLGVSYNLFTNSILFGQKMKRFIEESGPNQKNIFDEVFNTDFINKVRDKVKTDYDEIDNEYQNKNDQTGEIGKIISLTKELYQNTKKSELDFIDQKQVYILNLKNKINEIQTQVRFTKADSIKLKSLKKELGNKNPVELQNEIKECRDRYVSLNLKLAKVRSKISSTQTPVMREESLIKECKDIIANGDSGRCPTCGGIMNKEKIRERVKRAEGSLLIHEKALKTILGALKEQKAQEKELNRLISSSYKVLTSKEHKLDTYNKLEKTIGNLIRLKDEKLNSIKRVEDLEKLIQEKENETLEIKSPAIKKRLIKEKIKLRVAKEELGKLASTREELSWLIKGPLSNSGLKSFIFSSMVEDINNKLEAYSSVLGFKVKFGIGDNVRRDFFIQILKGKNIIPYSDLSGGQQQLVNVAIAFSLHDIVSENLSCNILIMDEIFENLSSKNIEKVTELIYKKVSNKLSLYLVTHRADYSPTNSKEIKVVLEKGISRYYTQ